MVSLNEAALARSFGAQLAELRRDILSSWRPEAPEAGFVEWAAIHSDTTLGIELSPLVTATIPAQRWAEAPVLAAAGFRLGLSEFTDDSVPLWLNGVRRLMARDPVPADRNSFFFRPVELLGLAAGASAVKDTDDSPTRWLRETIDEHGDRLSPLGTWSLVLGCLAAARVGARRELAARIDPSSAFDAALLLWVHLMDDQVAHTITSVGRDTLSRKLLEYASTAEVQVHGLAERGVLLIGLQRTVAAAIGGLELDATRPAQFVVGICRRFPFLVTALGDRYDNRSGYPITDEYDVQDLLRSVLRLHFDDVRPEEWNPSYGGVQSRSDLLLKPERLVIETKMTRKGLGQRELVEQLIVDKSQYRGHPDCGTLVCFVYDPQFRLRNPNAVERDLSEREGLLETLVVVSPQEL